MQPDIFIPQSTALVSLALLNVLLDYIRAGYVERVNSRHCGPLSEPWERRTSRESLALLGLRVDTALRYFSVAGPCFLKPKTVAEMFGLPRQRWKLVQDWLAAKGIERAIGDRGRWSVQLPTSNKLPELLTAFVPVPAAAVFCVRKSFDFYFLSRLYEAAEEEQRHFIAKGYITEKRRSVIPLCCEVWDGKLGLGSATGCGYARARSALRRLDALGFLDAIAMRFTPLVGHKRAWHGRRAFDMLRSRDFRALRGETGRAMVGGQQASAEAASGPGDAPLAIAEGAGDAIE